MIYSPTENSQKLLFNKSTLNKVEENVTYRKNIISMHKSGKGSVSRTEEELLEIYKKKHTSQLKKKKKRRLQ